MCENMYMEFGLSPNLEIVVIDQIMCVDIYDDENELWMDCQTYLGYGNDVSLIHTSLNNPDFEVLDYHDKELEILGRNVEGSVILL